MNNPTIFYRRVAVGKRHKYVPVKQYDEELTSALPYGCHVQHVVKNGWSRTYNVDPAVIPFVAAAMVLKHKIVNIISDAEKFRVTETPPTTRAHKDAIKLLETLYHRPLMLTGPSKDQMATDVLAVLQDEAVKLLTNESVYAAYEQFLIVAKLSAENQERQ